MERTIKINGHTYKLVLVSNDGTHWVQKYHITTCPLGYIAGEYWCDCGEMSHIGCWKFLKSIQPEKIKKKRYRPYNNKELEKLYQSSTRLTNTVTHVFGVVTGMDLNDQLLFVAGAWVVTEILMRDWVHEDGTKCCVEFVNND
jgi:hypothetical protein